MLGWTQVQQAACIACCYLGSRCGRPDQQLQPDGVGRDVGQVHHALGGQPLAKGQQWLGQVRGAVLVLLCAQRLLKLQACQQGR
jgi:hypothetical protein